MGVVYRSGLLFPKVLGKWASISNDSGIGAYSYAVATFLCKLLSQCGQKYPRSNQRQGYAVVQL